MKKGKSFDNLLTDLHSDPLPDSAVPALSLQSDGVVELSPLTSEEADRLASCEQIINEGITTFLAVGNALMEIRQNKLYRANHRTFEGYCRDRFQLKRQRAYELMGAAEVVNSLSEKSGLDDLSEISDKRVNVVLPTRESHATVLAEVPEEVRKEVWKQVVEEAEYTAKPVTATLIKQVAKRAGQPNSTPVKPEAESVDHTHHIQRIKKAVGNAAPQEIRIEVRGAWLIRHGLADAWRELRGRPEWVINDKFKDTLTLVEAKALGVIR
ncbi:MULTISPECIES: hypothetical protein [Spirosoma]|uniref:DUF3102 domain-containing protein n=1 Tax=Spirosoma liriopis TaxID=2937440 RepID=A0ABT0HSL2_9BACT|nr:MULTISPECIES: hypothetical protein [Spirosoma]MCK8495165.1 hypothetical protein [Spirosoma liriopis]UHG94248.1 hypothetical protein LQ777_26295 [Spirosoma oryzicola]